jgi:Ca2+/Na+ antiporter
MRNKLQMGKNQDNKMGLELKYQLTGWILFIICAIFFIAASLKNHDTLTFIGGVIFLIACIVFLIPLVRPNEKAGEDSTRHDV